MRILFLGDIMGRSGRDAAAEYLPQIKERLRPDVIIINGENSAGGKGITPKICRDLYELGADCITTGNHIWDQREIISYIDSDPKLLRPDNFPPGTPGRGIYVHSLPDGRKIAIMNFMGRLFIDAMDDPFAGAQAALKQQRISGAEGKSGNVSAIFVDFHAETTSEKMAFAHYLDGRVSAVVGTHTHIPTADAQILPGGTAYQTDAGMCGDYNSVIGVVKDVPIHRFTRKTPTERMSPADGPGTVCGTFMETDDKTGLATFIDAVRIGPRLKESVPDAG